VNQRGFENPKNTQQAYFQRVTFGMRFAKPSYERKFNPGQKIWGHQAPEEKVVMTQAKKQKRKLPHRNLICQSLGMMLLAGVLPVSSRAQSGARVAAPHAHPWAASTTAKTETKVSGAIQQVTSKHGATQVVIEGSKGTVTADLGPYASDTAKSLSAGEQVEIAGWTRSSNGTNVLIARQVTAGERQIVIRNEHGFAIRRAPATSTKPQRVGASFTGGAR
jgi:hypothetical protein